jgi:undecaprenyl-diphosphatase
VRSAARSCDETLLLIARTRGHSPRAERAVAGFSRVGEHAAVWLAMGAAGWLAQPARRRAWSHASAGVAATYVLNTLVKLAVRRPRPRLKGLPPLASTPTALSFPSAHTSTSIAATLIYSRLGVPALPLLKLTTALSYSRIYLGVHYPSDLLAGAALGAAVGLAWRPRA